VSNKEGPLWQQSCGARNWAICATESVRIYQVFRELQQ
jgi:hypothetical protein